MLAKRAETFDPSETAAAARDNDAGGDHAIFHGSDAVAVDLHALQKSKNVCEQPGPFRYRCAGCGRIPLRYGVQPYKSVIISYDRPSIDLSYGRIAGVKVRRDIRPSPRASVT
jgi:hypothetical protein